MNKQSATKSIFLTALILTLSFPATSFGNPENEMKGSLKEHKGSMAESKGSGSEMKEDAMMAKWQEYVTPNENHKVLNALVGNWDHTVKWWMSADKEPEVSAGTSEIKWIMGGRFIQQMTKGTSMGQPFEGMGFIGYNNGTKQYTSLWLDNMGTGIMSGAGQYDSATKTFNEKGQYTCPFKTESTFRGVTKIIDDDHFTYEMYSMGFDGKEFLSMVVDYIRTK
ncbi:hypothetical protein MNBD_UNCLBAC01-1925 [hydrothermal vent metagenome]|uniref:DUF1579 domain-containing protein n=1 Tax=hydrothermal vent metagenome TaxID=652676 RepID=A0A3B1E1M0_9ZZZZ